VPSAMLPIRAPMIDHSCCASRLMTRQRSHEMLRLSARWLGITI
jgi:hypothetical protein